jgi:hypothetical protein
MIVQEIVEFDGTPNYSIEFGVSTWTEKETSENQTLSVRNRFDTEEGKYNVHASSELDFWDLEQLMIESLQRDRINRDRILEIIETANQSLQRI